MILYVTHSLACNPSGAVLLEKQADTATDTQTTIERSWTGHREIAFESHCEFSIYEDGERILNEEEEEVFQVVASSCSDCQLYRLQTTPEYIECGELGTLGVGGERYRSIRYTDDGLDLWYIYEPNPPHIPEWNIEFITTAQGNDESWGYAFEDNFQAFVYNTVGQLSLDP